MMFEVYFFKLYCCTYSFMVVLVHMYYQFYSMFIVLQCFIGQIPLYVKNILEIEIWLVIMFL